MTRRRRIMVVGSGGRFVSGISYYTHQLACALAEHHDVSVTLMRNLMPRRLYPGAARVGEPIAKLEFPAGVRVHDGVDWHGAGLARSLRQLMRDPPEVVVMQWWTATVAHTYLVLALAARRRGARVILELHEVQDTGEATLPGVARYGRAMLRALLRRADATVVHCTADQASLTELLDGRELPGAVIPHGPFTQYQRAVAGAQGGTGAVLREAPRDATNVLFFGTIRPYKGLEVLVRAFSALPRADAQRLWLTIVGETWESWTEPARLVTLSSHRDRITFVNRYVSDDEGAGWLAGADAMALPYLRSSASGPLHVAMSHGLPVAVSDLPSLREAAAGYTGATFVAPGDAVALGAALVGFAGLSRLSGPPGPSSPSLPSGLAGAPRGGHADPRSWAQTVNGLEALVARMEVGAG